MAFYQQQPFTNPQIPFTGPIQGGLQEGRTITVIGRVLPDTDRFSVNLQCGSRSEADIALHINPRYDSGPEYIVTNTYWNSDWGDEENIQQALLPMGSPFMLIVLVTHESYKISVNGNHIMDYKHRIPFNKVDTILVEGKVEIHSIAFQSPVPEFAYAPGFAVPSLPAPASLNVPYQTTINGGLRPGKYISVQGVINPQADRIRINLSHKNGTAFHYNPRFDQNVVVCNNKTMEQWGLEEISSDMPFHKGQNFQVVIACNPEHYSVFVNGQQVQTFKHRFTQLEEIDFLEVAGDLSLSSVDITPNF
ncbi:galectin-9-like [Trichomycterus rosablanca]|uniref:galectin-9-like n=1 Tax=Trichomycterus rosablanca TaxID=2290929 RepID=UPI002F35F4D1